MFEKTTKRTKVSVIALACVVALTACFALTGCFGGGNVSGKWSFKSMQASEATLSGLDDAGKADKEAEASMLAVFMSDASIDFGENNVFTFTFLGEPYQGTWESADGGARVTMPEGDVSSGAGTYRVSGDELIFTADENAGRLAGFEVHYVRGDAAPSVESSSVESAPATETDQNAQPEQSSEPAEMPNQPTEQQQAEAASFQSAESASSAQ